MKEILEELNREVGITGSLVVTHDGLLVASALGSDLDREAVGALAANIIMATNNAMEQIGNDRCVRFSLSSSYGRLIFRDIDIAYLVVVTHQNISLDTAEIAIKGAAYKIKHRRAE